MDDDAEGRISGGRTSLAGRVLCCIRPATTHARTDDDDTALGAKYSGGRGFWGFWGFGGVPVPETTHLFPFPSFTSCHPVAREKLLPACLPRAPSRPLAAPPICICPCLLLLMLLLARTPVVLA